MINVALLTAKEFRDLQGKNNTDSTRFNPFVVNGYFAITQEEIENTTIQGFEWLNDKPIVEMDRLTIPDTTPPQMTGYGLMIPQAAVDAKLFTNNQFEMNGFVIDFTPIGDGLAIDLAYLGWNEFRQEQLKPINVTVKKVFTELWDSVAADYEYSVLNPNESKIISLT